MSLLLKNGRLLDPGSGVDREADVLLQDGKVARVERSIDAAGMETVDVSGMVVCPGFIDMHVHLREPGQEWKETIESGARAAARGGFTGVACMPNTVPVNDSRSVTEMIMAEAAENAEVAVYPIGCVTKGQKGDELAEMSDMRVAGARGFSDDGHPVLSNRMMRRALEYSKILDVVIIDHCEDPALVDGGVMNEGAVSTRLGLRGWASIGEDVMVQRDILLAEYTGGHVHIAHMSTGRSAGFVRAAKQRGIPVSCEVTPHHLVLTEDAVGEYDTQAKMNPPLRTEKDRKELLEAIADGTIDVIATDHAPHHADEKCVEFSLAPFGIVGLETAISLCLDRLVHGGVIELPRLVELMSVNPARLLRLDKGRLAVGCDADVTVVDPERRVKVEASTFASKGKNTPFDGWELRGAPTLTVVGGKVVHDARRPASS